MGPNIHKFRKNLYRHPPAPDEREVEELLKIELPENLRGPYFVPHSSYKGKEKLLD